MDNKCQKNQITNSHDLEQKLLNMIQLAKMKSSFYKEFLEQRYDIGYLPGASSIDASGNEFAHDHIFGTMFNSIMRVWSKKLNRLIKNSLQVVDSKQCNVRVREPTLGNTLSIADFISLATLTNKSDEQLIQIIRGERKIKQ